jgi:hypothetical protein
MDCKYNTLHEPTSSVEKYKYGKNMSCYNHRAYKVYIRSILYEDMSIGHTKFNYVCSVFVFK